MGLDGGLGQHQLGGDLGVGQPGGDLGGDPAFPGGRRREFRRLAAGRMATTARERLGTRFNVTTLRGALVAAYTGQP
jgi:hypothetical protein